MPAEESVKVEMYPIFKEPGFGRKFEYAQFLQEVVDVSGINLEHLGIIKEMTRELFYKTRWVQYVIATMFMVGYFIPFFVQCFLVNSATVVGLNISCLITIVFLQINELIQMKYKGFTYWTSILNILDQI
jgi:hypothetical protein